MKKLLLAMLMVGGVAQAYNGYSKIPTQSLIDMRNLRNQEDAEAKEWKKYPQQSLLKAKTSVEDAVGWLKTSGFTDTQILNLVQSMNRTDLKHIYYYAKKLDENLTLLEKYAQYSPQQIRALVFLILYPEMK